MRTRALLGCATPAHLRVRHSKRTHMIAGSSAAVAISPTATPEIMEEAADVLVLATIVSFVLTVSVTAAVVLLTAVPSQVVLALAAWL